jgi:hypothetical protein
VNETSPTAEELEALTMGHVRLPDLVDRTALGELARSLYALFHIPVRFFAEDGTLLADAIADQELCRHLDTLPQGRAACSKTVGTVKRLMPEGGPISHPCFTGAVYQVLPIEYDHRRLGRVILGPYVPASVETPPDSLLGIDPGLTRPVALALLPKMPRASEDTVR